MPLNPLLDLLLNPASSSSLDTACWNDIVRQARNTQVLGQLGVFLERQSCLSRLLPAVQRQFELARLTAKSRADAALWEISTIRRAVSPEIPIVVLKGGAYLLAGDPNGEGRYFSDVDILVPRESLDEAEANLIADGWKPSSVSLYDQAYYRNWTHELPPMEHVRRRTVLDLHHAIVPRVSRYAFDPQLLWRNVQAVGEGLYVLATQDRLIHCALHLIQEGEPAKIFRDLFDLYLLVEQYGLDQSALDSLHVRSRELGVDRLVDAAIWAALRLFGDASVTSVGRGILSTLLVDTAKDVAPYRSLTGRISGVGLLAHSHLIKMPLKILIPHLAHKGIERLQKKD